MMGTRTSVRRPGSWVGGTEGTGAGPCGVRVSPGLGRAPGCVQACRPGGGKVQPAVHWGWEAGRGELQAGEEPLPGPLPHPAQPGEMF